MKFNTYAIILYHCILVILLGVSYSWGLKWWIQLEPKKDVKDRNEKRRVKVYPTMDECKKVCPKPSWGNECYGVKEYSDVYKAIDTMRNETNKNISLTSAVCYTNNETEVYGYNEWAHKDSPYFKPTKAIHHPFEYKDICNSFCQPLFQSGCTYTKTGWYCYKYNEPVLIPPKNKTASTLNLPKKMSISNGGNCLNFVKPLKTERKRDRIQFTGSCNTTSSSFYTEHLDADTYLILHDFQEKDSNVTTKYALTYKRNVDILIWAEIQPQYYKQEWIIVSLCHGTYNLSPYGFGGALCARINYLRKCDDDLLEVAVLQHYEIKEWTASPSRMRFLR